MARLPNRSRSLSSLKWSSIQWSYALSIGLISGLLLVACEFGNSADHKPKLPQLQLTSPAFEAEAFIPSQFTCDGANQSPVLSWAAPPTGTQSWALFLSSGTQVHWVAYDLPSDLRSLPASIPVQPFLTQGGVQGKNDFGDYGYRGPCAGHANGSADAGGNGNTSNSAANSYFFKLYAVDKLLDLPPGVTATEVQTALQNHILAEATLEVRYRR